MPVHPQPFRLFLRGLLDRTEEGVSEVPLAGGASVGLDVVPEVIIWQFKDAGEERQEATVDGLGQVLQRKNRIEIQSAGQLKVKDEGSSKSPRQAPADSRCKTPRSRP